MYGGDEYSMKAASHDLYVFLFERKIWANIDKLIFSLQERFDGVLQV